MLPNEIHGVDDVKLWIAGDVVRQEGQEKLNDRLEKRVYSLEKRVSAIERRIMWISGLSAGLGGLLGNSVPGLFGG